MTAWPSISNFTVLCKKPFHICVYITIKTCNLKHAKSKTCICNLKHGKKGEQQSVIGACMTQWPLNGHGQKLYEATCFHLLSPVSWRIFHPMQFLHNGYSDLGPELRAKCFYGNRHKQVCLAQVGELVVFLSSAAAENFPADVVAWPRLIWY